MRRLNRIKSELSDQGKSQVWLAEKIDRSIYTVNAYCNNRKQPRLDELARIADVLEVDIKDLIVSTR